MGVVNLPAKEKYLLKNGDVKSQKVRWKIQSISSLRQERHCVVIRKLFSIVDKYRLNTGNLCCAGFMFVAWGIECRMVRPFPLAPIFGFILMIHNCYR